MALVNKASRQCMIDRYYGSIEFSFTPWNIEDRTRQTRIDEFLKRPKKNRSTQPIAMSMEEQSELMGDLGSDFDIPHEEEGGLAGTKRARPDEEGKGEEKMSSTEEGSRTIATSPSTDEPPKKKRRLKKKFALANKGGGTLLDDLVSDIDAGITAAMEKNEDEDLMKVEKEEKKEEEKEKVPAPMECKSVEIMFNDADFDTLLGESEPAPAPSSTSPNGDKKRVLSEKTLWANPSQKEGEETSQPPTPTEPGKMVVYNGIPIEHTADAGMVRCVYAANPAEQGYSPLVLELNDGDNEAEVRESALHTLAWGIYATHMIVMGEGSGPGRRRKPASSGGSDGMGEDGMAVLRTDRLEEAPWFCLVSDPECIALMASPFFAYKVRVVPLDRVRTHFGPRRSVPIFYVYTLDEKLPLWVAGSHWDAAQLVRLAADTIYAHVETKCKPNVTTKEAIKQCVYDVLKAVDDFPIAANKPSQVLLSPISVPINNCSLRKDRMDRLKELIPSSLKEPAVEGLAVMDTRPLVISTSASPGMITPADYLFLDLEKPTSIWEALVDKAALPVALVSSISDWRQCRSDVVIARFKEVQRFATHTSDTPRTLNLDMEMLKQAHRYMSFGPEWFANWFTALRAPPPETNSFEERYRLYAFFCASWLWREMVEQTQRYGPTAIYLFSKPNREYLFEMEWHRRDRDALAACSIAKATLPVSMAAVPEITSDTERQERLMHDILDYLKDMNKVAKETGPTGGITFHFGEKDGRLQDAYAIHEGRYGTTRRFLRDFVLGNCLLFASVRDRIKIEGLRGLPPLMVQSTYVYGSLSGEGSDPSEFFTALKASLGSDFVLLVLDPPDSLMALGNVLTQAAKGGVRPHMIAFRDFHLWSLEAINYLVSILAPSTPQLAGAATTKNLLKNCTHLLFTGYMHTLGDMSGGGSLLWELTVVAQRLERIMKMGDSALAGTETLLEGLFDKYAKLERWKQQQRNPTGSAHLSETMYPHEMRQEQLEANELGGGLLFKHSGTEKLVVQTVCGRITKQMDTAAIVLFSRNVTRNRLEALFKAERPSLFTAGVGKSPLRFLSYITMERTPIKLRGAQLIVLADLEYEGPARPTYCHLNAALEHASHGVLAISNRLDTLPVTAFSNVFYRNDDKSDRVLNIISRCPILLTEFETYIRNPKVDVALRPPLRHHGKASPVLADQDED